MNTHPALANSVDDILECLASVENISGTWKFGSAGELVPCELSSGRVADTRKLTFHPMVDEDRVTAFTKENQSAPFLAALDTLESLVQKARQSEEATDYYFFSTGFSVDGNFVMLRLVTQSRGRNPVVILALGQPRNDFGFFGMTYAMALIWREQVRELLAA